MLHVTAVVVSWNVRALLKRCLLSIQRSQRHGDLSCDIIVVDNASSDGSPEMVKQLFPDVALIAADTNLGFTRGNNAGLSEARGQYVLLLNPDAELIGDALLTMAQRMDAQSANAMAVARFLEAHPKVEQVAYPGLESFAQHELASRQASGYGAMMWFEVKGGLAAGKQLMDNIEVWSLAENLGSVESLITHPVTMTHADVEPEERARVGIIDGLVRLSVGLEDADDLLADLDQALAKAFS